MDVHRPGATGSLRSLTPTPRVGATNYTSATPHATPDAAPGLFESEGGDVFDSSCDVKEHTRVLIGQRQITAYFSNEDTARLLPSGRLPAYAAPSPSRSRRSGDTLVQSKVRNQ